MRAVVQRVLRSSVSIGGEVTASIDKGLMVLLGVEVGDTEKDARYIADKCVGLRVFDDENGHLDMSYTFDHTHIVGKHYKYWGLWIYLQSQHFSA